MKKQNGITLIALVISIIVMLILAGVSINAIVGENGVLTKAQNAKLAAEEAAILEELELILFEYNSSEFLGEANGFTSFLADKKADGTIQDYIYLDNLIVKYKDGYYEAISDGEFYEINGKLEDDLSGGGFGDNYIVTPDNLTTNNMEFQAGSSYVVLDKINGEDFNFQIPAGDPVTIKLVGDMTIDNKGYKRSAIDLEEGAVLNLYVYGNVVVNSGYSTQGATGEMGTMDQNEGGEGAYAGIHVPETATLNLYGSGTLVAYGGNASPGGAGTSMSLEQSQSGNGGGRRWRSRSWHRWKWRKWWRI